MLNQKEICNMDYIMIPAKICYFVFGFISCFTLFIIIAVVNIKKETKKRQEIIDNIIKSINNGENK